jgi:hypothetical protein
MEKNKEKKSKKEDFNLKSFMMSEAYQEVKERLQKALNHNSVMFNAGNRDKHVKRQSNLLTSSTPTFTKTKAEKNDLKKAKYQWKLDLGTKEHKREEIGRRFLNVEMPNWNIKFSYLNVKQLQRH